MILFCIVKLILNVSIPHSLIALFNDFFVKFFSIILKDEQLEEEIAVETVDTLIPESEEPQAEARQATPSPIPR